ncbi:hypothetical protein O5511_01445 [Escherichia coli]|nr:hypothetical protein [Escherichia coli]
MAATLRVRKVSNNNPLHQQTSNRVPRYAGNTRKIELADGVTDIGQ